MTFANNFDPDEAPQIVGLHLRSKLFDIQIINQQKNGWKQNFLKILKETNIWKNYPACKVLSSGYCQNFLYNWAIAVVGSHGCVTHFQFKKFHHVNCNIEMIYTSNILNIACRVKNWVNVWSLCCWGWQHNTFSILRNFTMDFNHKNRKWSISKYSMQGKKLNESVCFRHIVIALLLGWWRHTFFHSQNFYHGF